MTTGRPKVEEVTELSVRSVRAPRRSSPRHVHRRTLVTSSPISQRGNKWNPAGRAVQVLLAVHRTVIETFISPLVVREGMSINGAHSHHWNFEETAAALGSFPCRGQVRFAKVRPG